MTLTVIMMSAALASGSTPLGPINLFCQGAHGSNESQPTSSVGIVGGRVGYAVGSETVRRTVDDTAYLQIGTDGTGRIKLPPSFDAPIMSGANKDGWHQLIKVERRENEIVGRVRITSMNKPKFRLDRIAGTFNVSDGFDDFSGRCEPYDPAAVERKF